MMSMQLGRPWRNSRCHIDAPIPREATTKSRSRSSSSRARTIRDSTGQDRSEITTIVGTIPVPAMDASTRRKITGGSVMARSTSRMIPLSTTLPPKLAMAPTRKPITIETTTDTNATVSEMRPPCSSRARMSRPTPSVPNQWEGPGPWFIAFRSMSLGPKVHHSG